MGGSGTGAALVNVGRRWRKSRRVVRLMRLAGWLGNGRRRGGTKIERAAQAQQDSRQAGGKEGPEGVPALSPPDLVSADESGGGGKAGGEKCLACGSRREGHMGMGMGMPCRDGGPDIVVHALPQTLRMEIHFSSRASQS